MNLPLSIVLVKNLLEKVNARRAWGYPHQCEVIPVDNHESFKLDLDEAISKLCFPQEDQQTALLRLKSKNTRKIILLIFTYKPEAELSQLQDLSQDIINKFRAISVVFATGQELPEDLPDGVIRIIPPLLPDEEETRYIQYADIDDFIHQ